MPAYAAIDIGSNTVQYQLAVVEGDRLLRRESDLRSTRLGAVERPGWLSAAAIAFTAQAVADYAARAQASGARLRIIATSAARDAENSDELRRAVRAAAPAAPEIEIVSGEREAQLSWQGARASLAFPATWPVADIGGASSELIRAGAAGIRAVSIDVGAVRAVREGWDRAEIRRRLRDGYGGQDKLPPDAAVVGVGGCITTAAGLTAGLSAYDRAAIEGSLLGVEQLEALASYLLPLGVEQRCRLSPLLEKRGEIMLEGLYIWLALLELLDGRRVLVTGGGLLDGAIREMITASE